MTGGLQCGTTEVCLFDAERAAPECQPCFASWSGKRWVFGGDDVQFHTDAISDHTNTYFMDCAKTMVMRHGAWAGTPADLIYEQFRDLLVNIKESMLFMPSSVYSDEQLGVLGGILQAVTNCLAVLKMPLAYGGILPAGNYAVIEMEAHDAVLTELDVTADSATIKPAKIFHGIGLQHAYGEQFQLICERFIQRHRHDVGHAAGNKSRLLRQLQAQWRDDKEAVSLRSDDMEVHIDKAELAVALPKRLAERVGGRECYLTPSFMTPSRHIFSQVEWLPLLQTDDTQTLARNVPPSHAPDTDKVRVFQSIDR